MMYESTFVCLYISTQTQKSLFLDADLSTLSPSRTFYQYETIPIRSFYENSQNLVEINELHRKDPSIVPSFQRKLPIIPMIILGSMEILSGLAVLIMEILIFDIAIGVWCGFIYLIAGIVTLILGLLKLIFFKKKDLYIKLVLLTDRERHQISAVLIFQFIGTIEISLFCRQDHMNFYFSITFCNN